MMEGVSGIVKRQGTMLRLPSGRDYGMLLANQEAKRTANALKVKRHVQ
jgi:hypothetical protein